MIAYASRTGTRRNLDALRGAGWRLLVSARGVLRPEGFRYALDNGAWTAHQEGLPFDSDAFLRAVDLLGVGADWTVIPDVVGDRDGTLEALRRWLPRLSGLPLLFAVQDGMQPADLPALGPSMGLFVGGSTAWKESTMRIWSRVAHDAGAICHVGRVNTVRRIRLCHDAQVDSFDGTSASKFAISLPKLDRARNHLHLFSEAQ